MINYPITNNKQKAFDETVNTNFKDTIFYNFQVIAPDSIFHNLQAITLVTSLLLGLFHDYSANKNQFKVFQA